MRKLAIEVARLAQVVAGVCLACCPVREVSAGETPGPPAVVVVKVGRVYPASGEPVDGGMVVIRGGKVEAIGRGLSVPEDAEVLEVEDGTVTPGLIDACCTLDPEIPAAGGRWAFSEAAPSFWKSWATVVARRQEDIDRGSDPLDSEAPIDVGINWGAAAVPPDFTWAEEVSEVVPHRLVIDSVNLLSHDFRRLLEGGVTTVYVSPDSASVIGCRGAIVRTAGPLSERTIRRADAVKASMGSDPSDRGRRNYLPPPYGPAPSFHTRRPTTRMGVDWVFRKAFYDAQREAAGQTIHGADMPPTAALPVLQQILEGKIGLRIQARMQHDIYSALRLAREFHLRFILEEATEAYRCLPELKAAGVPVIFGPLFMTPGGYRAGTDEVYRPRLNSPRQLADAGIEFALTAQERRDEEGLAQQAMMAIRSGLTPAQALAAVTTTPAKLMNLADELGRLAPGARADLVIWSGEPFSATSRALVVLIDGRVVYDARAGD